MARCKAYCHSMGRVFTRKYIPKCSGCFVNYTPHNNVHNIAIAGGLVSARSKVFCNLNISFLFTLLWIKASIMFSQASICFEILKNASPKLSITSYMIFTMGLFIRGIVQKNTNPGRSKLPIKRVVPVPCFLQHIVVYTWCRKQRLNTRTAGRTQDEGCPVFIRWMFIQPPIQSILHELKLVISSQITTVPKYFRASTIHPFTKIICVTVYLP